MTTPIRVPDHERRVRPSPHAPHYVAAAVRRDLDAVPATDETVRRACMLAGRIEGLPPIPASAGRHARIPPKLASKCVRTNGSSSVNHGCGRASYASRLDGNWVYS